eukprot:1146200-Pelagomonas_calceolata.AAC.1
MNVVAWSLGSLWKCQGVETGKEFASDLQVRHMSYLNNTLGVKRTTTNWANSTLRCNGETLRRVLKADVNIYSRDPSCWTALVLDAFQGLRRSDSFVQAVRQGTTIPIQEFTDDLRHRLRAVWRDVEGVNRVTLIVPFDQNVRAPARLPRDMHLDLSQHVVRIVSRFRPRAHTLKVETAARDTRTLFCVIAVLVMRFKMRLMPF